MATLEEQGILDGDVKARVFRKCGFIVPLAVTFLVTLMIAACGTAAGPVAEESQSPSAAHVQEGEGSAAPSSVVSVASVAPQFTLPSAGGDTFDLTSFAGDKNVVLVFYRGFW